tara:strand:- start:1194 stop:1490 length:297 start_codon:yes stop_codon:yes gene_type:complete
LKNKEFIIAFFIGLVCNFFGILISIIVLFKTIDFSELIYYFNKAINENSLTKLISLGALVNLIVFFIFLKYNHDNKAKGILAATIFAAFLTVIINYLN